MALQTFSEHFKYIIWHTVYMSMTISWSLQMSRKNWNCKGTQTWQCHYRSIIGICLSSLSLLKTMLMYLENIIKAHFIQHPDVITFFLFAFRKLLFIQMIMSMTTNLSGDILTICNTRLNSHYCPLRLNAMTIFILEYLRLRLYFYPPIYPYRYLRNT